MKNNNSNESFSLGHCEYLVSVRADKKIILLRIAALIIGAVLMFSLMGLLSKIPQVMFLWAVLIVALEVIFFRKTSREIEYTVATGTMIIDTVYGKSIRKKLVEVKLSEVESVMLASDGATATLPDAKVINACNINDSYKYLMIVPKSEDHQTLAIYFSGCKKLIDCIKYYNRNCIKERKD